MRSGHGEEANTRLRAGKIPVNETHTKVRVTPANNPKLTKIMIGYFDQQKRDDIVDEIEKRIGLRHVCDLMSAASYKDSDLPTDDELHNEEMTLAHGPDWRNTIKFQHLQGRTA